MRAYSPYCSLYIFQDANKENVSHNQELLELVIISFILVTLMFDLGVILWGEIKCWSLLGVKVLKYSVYLGASVIWLEAYLATKVQKRFLFLLFVIVKFS